MPHLTVWERKGIEKAQREAVLAALDERFGAVPAQIEQTVRSVSDPDILSQLLRQAIKAPTLEAFDAVLRERAAS